jgi:hypothetical protein
MHYEPVWAGPTLADEHVRILEALRWNSVEMHDAIAMCDRFVQVNNCSRQMVEQKIKAHLGIP